MPEDFLALSEVLTGVRPLDPVRSRQYLDRLNSTPFATPLRQILDVFRTLDTGSRDPGPTDTGSTLTDQVRQKILSDDSLRPTICEIILLWYTSSTRDNEVIPPPFRYGTQEEYFSSLAWQIMGAHVPGLSGGYFGHWRYRPDNEPRGTK